MDKPQISPLRYAPVEMTKGRVVMARSRGPGMDKPQISPLRYAPVEMTKGRVVMARSRGLEYGQTADLSTGEISVWMLLLGNVFERPVQRSLFGFTRACRRLITVSGTNPSTEPPNSKTFLMSLELTYEYFSSAMRNTVSTCGASRRFISAICSSYS